MLSPTKGVSLSSLRSRVTNENKLCQSEWIYPWIYPSPIQPSLPHRLMYGLKAGWGREVVFPLYRMMWHNCGALVGIGLLDEHPQIIVLLSQKPVRQVAHLTILHMIRLYFNIFVQKIYFSC